MTRADSLLPDVPDLRNAPLAIASLALGIFGCCLPIIITPIAAIALGAISLVQINRSSVLKGHGYAVAGIVLGLISLLLSCVMFPGTYRDMLVTKRSLDMTIQMRAVGGATFKYANANRGQLPDASTWSTDISQYVDSAGKKGFDRPYYVGPTREMVMNETLSGAAVSSIADPSKTVLIFESTQGSPSAGGRELLPDKSHLRPQAQRFVILFVDGHVDQVQADLLDGLIWNAGSARNGSRRTGPGGPGGPGRSSGGPNGGPAPAENSFIRPE